MKMEELEVKRRSAIRVPQSLQGRTSEAGARIFTAKWKGLRGKVADPAHADYEGNRSGPCEKAGCASADFMLDLALSEDLDTLFTPRSSIQTRTPWAGC